MEPHIDHVEIDHWLEEVLSDFKNSFQADGKALHFYPTQPVGAVLIDLPTLDRLTRSILATIRIFAHDTRSVEVALRREKAVFQILFEHDGSPVPPTLRDQILRTIPPEIIAKSKPGAPAPDELLASWAQALGGHYTSTVTEGAGISYVVQLPLKIPKNASNTTTPPNNYHSTIPLTQPEGWNDSRFSASQRVLIVEDNEGFQDILNAELSSLYKLDFAENGRIGLDKVQKNEYDIIVSDVMMPEMNGFAFAEAVRSFDHSKRVPFLFLTSLNSASDLIHGITAGADAYLTKPVRMDLLKAHLYALLFRAAALQKQPRKPEFNRLTLQERVDTLIVEHMGNPDFSIDSVASLLGISRSSFYRAWAETGEEPVNTRILKARLHFSIQMMEENAFTLSQISAACGFSDSAYFSKAFKKVYGVIPSKYR